jgi:hypothetical protein
MAAAASTALIKNFLQEIVFLDFDSICLNQRNHGTIRDLPERIRTGSGMLYLDGSKYLRV